MSRRLGRRAADGVGWGRGRRLPSRREPRQLGGDPARHPSSGWYSGVVSADSLQTGAERGRAFVWPPRAEAGDGGGPEPPGGERTGQPDGALTCGGADRPAARAEAGGAPTAIEVAPKPGARGAISLRLSFERTWLGLRSAPWRVRAEEAGFSPDPDGAYCGRCGGPVGPGEIVGDVVGEGIAASCGSCREQRLPWGRAVRLGAFEGALREAILEAKYARWRRLGFDLGRLAGGVLGRRLTEAGVDPVEAALVPVPMSFRRRWTRGIDHTLAIARGVRASAGCRILLPLRRRHRPPQASLPESRREANVRGSFIPRNGVLLGDYPAVVVLDDVRTTGATLRSVCRAIAARERRLGGQLHSDRVWVLSLAVVTPPDRRAGVPGAESAEEDSPGGVSV